MIRDKLEMAYFSIRNKLFLSFSALAFVALLTSFYFVYTTVEKSLQVSINADLLNSTNLIRNLVHTVAKSSIENHLYGIAETELQLVQGVYADYRRGRYSEDEAKELASRLLLRQRIGVTGYTYCLNSAGIVAVHRDKGVEGTDVSGYGFVQSQLKLKSGYLEYKWKNPDESTAREKALYMSYFPEWDWIISVSAYKSEFAYLIDLNNISAALGKVSFGRTGYPFILAADGTFIYHPRIFGNVFEMDFSREGLETLREVIHKGSGSLRYKWKDPGDTGFREKIAIFEPIEDYGWYAGTTAYIDELYSPLVRIRNIFIGIFIAYLFLNLLASYVLSSLFSRPLRVLMANLSRQQPEAITPIQGHFSNDEIGGLACYLNQFIDKLSEYHVALTNEIAERKASEKALRTSEQTFYTLFDNSFQFIALLDRQGRVHKINQTALNFRNLKTSDIEGMLFWETPWWSHSEVLVKQLKSAIEEALTGRTARFEAHSTAVRDIYLDITVKPVIDDAGDVVYLIAEARDVSEIRRAEKELQQAQKMESVGMLAGGIAHDFNNALSGILGTIDLLKFKHSSGKAVEIEALFEHLDRISTAAFRARDIVNKLLTLSKKNDFEFVAVDLRDILQDVGLIARNSFDKSIFIEESFEGSARVLADQNSLEQVFLNLYINSAHAMTLMRKEGNPWGGVLKVGYARVCREAGDGLAGGDYWCVSISDTGVGIPAANLERIFDPFFTTKSKGVGSGLGLAMVYNIVRQHGGFVEIESHLGEGTEFRICLPASEEVVSQEENAAVPVAVDGEETILVIDDEELLRINAREFLDICGYKVLLAADGAEGVEIYRQHQLDIDAVLLDLVMPVMSGKETYFALKEINPRVKVLFSSGFRQDARVEEIMAAGANGFIQKPYSLYNLSQGINKILHEE